MVRIFLATLLATLTLAADPSIRRVTNPHPDVEAKPAPDANRIADNSGTIALVNTFIDDEIDIAGTSLFLKEDTCIYLPNLVAQVTWVRPTTLNEEYQVFFYTSPYCNGTKIVAQHNFFYDISHSYSIAAKLIEYPEDDDDEDCDPPYNSTTRRAEKETLKRRAKDA